jgi:hypothetical protein
MTEYTYRVASLDGGEPLLSARFQITGPAVEAARLGPARGLFELPVVSRRGRRWRHSFADFGLARAEIRPIALRLAFECAFLPGLPVGELAIDGLADGHSWAFRLQTRWTLAAPWRSACRGAGQSSG